MELPEIREQPELKCCCNCFNFYNDEDGYCCMDSKGNVRDTSPSSICDKFEFTESE